MHSTQPRVQAVLLRHAAHQLLAEVVPELGQQVHEAVEGVGLRMLRRARRGVGAEVVVQRRQQLVHALHVAQARVELGKYKQAALHLLRVLN